jgi:hypothetical protein
MTFDDLAASLGYQPESVWWIVHELRHRFSSDAVIDLDTGELNAAAEATVRAVVADIENVVMQCPDLR